MEDEEIIAMYWRRDENAIYETSVKYGSLCWSIARNILASREDCEECVNDAYFSVWRSIPEQRPRRFPAFLGRITRNRALSRWAYLTAEKRNPVAAVSLSELGECVTGHESVEDEAEARRIERIIDDFLWSEREDSRTIFIRRYWYFDSIQRISDKTGYGQSKVKTTLHRARQRLRARLESEGVQL